jgi:hypothetical protein
VALAVGSIHVGFPFQGRIIEFFGYVIMLLQSQEVGLFDLEKENLT